MAFVTGHAREGGEDALDETVTASADKHTTLVVYMGLSTLPSLVARLVAAKLSPDTPAAAVERGTTPEQRAVYAPLNILKQVGAPVSVVELLCYRNALAISDHSLEGVKVHVTVFHAGSHVARSEVSNLGHHWGRCRACSWLAHGSQVWLQPPGRQEL